MATEFKLPDLGENIDGGDVLKVLVKEGDTVTAEQSVFELETDKALVEVPCPYAGTVSKVHVGEGDSVKVGDLLLTLEDGEGGSAKSEEPAPAKSEKKEEAPAVKESAPAAKTAARKPAPAPVAEEPEAEDEEDEAEDEPVKAAAEPRRAAPAPAPSSGPADPAAAAPATRRLARELGVDLAKVKPTGEGGRVTREDVISAVRNLAQPGAAKKASAPAVTPTTVNLPGEADEDNWGPISRDKLPKIRKTIAVNLAKSASTIPHVTNFDDADVTDLEAFRQSAKGDFDAEGLKLTMVPLLVRAVALALRRHPKVNASIDLENNQIIYKAYVNVGIAIDSERGLVVPNIRDADRMTVAEITKALATMVTNVRKSKFSPEDLRGGTFTISNLGAIGGTYSTPIINPPEVAILLVGRSRKLPVVMPDDTIKPRLMMPLSLSYDHRLVDGADAARFLNDLIALLQSPSRLLLAP